jgi:hypothetical protein
MVYLRRKKEYYNQFKMMNRAFKKIYLHYAKMLIQGKAA